MDFPEPSWSSILNLYTGLSLRRWLCMYFAIFPLLSAGCEPLNNIPCTITRYETQLMTLKSSLPLVSNPTSTLPQNEPAPTTPGPPPPSSAPTTPPSKAVGRLPALG